MFLPAFSAKYPRLPAARKVEGLAHVADPEAEGRASLELGTDPCGVITTAIMIFDVRDRPLDDLDSISVHELATWRHSATPHTVLDVREADELRICELEDAIHIPMSQITARVADLPFEHPLVVLCHHGSRSMRVVKFLRSAGYENAVNLDGGIDAWARQIDPSVRRY